MATRPTTSQENPPSDSSSDDDSMGSQDSFDNVMEDEATALGDQLEQGEIASDTGSDEGPGAENVDRMFAKLKRTQKKLDNRLKQIADQLESEGDAYK